MLMKASAAISLPRRYWDTLGFESVPCEEIFNVVRVHKDIEKKVLCGMLVLIALWFGKYPQGNWCQKYSIIFRPWLSACITA